MMDWIKQRIVHTFKYNTLSALLAISISMSLLKVDPSKSPKNEVAVFSQSENELFEYITKSDEFHEVLQLEIIFCTLFAY